MDYWFNGLEVKRDMVSLNTEVKCDWMSHLGWARLHNAIPHIRGVLNRFPIDRLR